MKKAHIYLSAIIVLVCMQFSAYSQIKLDSAGNHVYKHNLGFEVGQVTEFGLSYRYMSGKLGIQANMGGHRNEYENKFLIGETLLYSLFRNKYTDFYIYQSNSFKYEFDKYNYNYYYEDYMYPPNQLYSPKETYGVNNGIGFGMEAVLLNHVSINASVGYGATDNFKEVNTVGSFGMYYKF